MQFDTLMTLSFHAFENVSALNTRSIAHPATLRRSRFSWVISAIGLLSAVVVAGCTTSNAVKSPANPSARTTTHGACGTLYVGWRVYLTNRRGARLRVTALMRYKQTLSRRRPLGSPKCDQSLSNIRSPQSLLIQGLYLQDMALRHVNGKSIPPWCMVIPTEKTPEGLGPWFLSRRGNWEFGARFGEFIIDPLTYELINASHHCKISKAGVWASLRKGSPPGGGRSWASLTPDTFGSWASAMLSVSPRWLSRLRAARPLQSIVCGWKSGSLTIQIKQTSWSPKAKRTKGKVSISKQPLKEGEAGPNGR